MSPLKVILTLFVFIGLLIQSERLSGIEHTTRDGQMWVNAGNDTTVCLSNPWIALNGSSENYWFVVWTSAGDGFFNDANILQPDYYPGIADRNSGTVRLYLTAFSFPPHIYTLTDSIDITIVNAPMSNAGCDAHICETSSFATAGQAIYYSSISWSTTGDGYFEGANQLDAIYHPGPADKAAGHTILCIAAFPASPCVMPYANCMNLYIENIPVITLPDEKTICRGSWLQIEADICNCDSLFWSTAGDGYFSDPYIASPKYYPGAQDIINTQVELQITAFSHPHCNTQVTEGLLLHIQPHPTVSQTPVHSICINDTLHLQATANHYNAFFWITYGDGTFIDANTLSPSYIPGPIDVSRGLIFIEIIVDALYPCNFFNGAYIETAIYDHPFVHAGNDLTLCSDQQVNLEGVALNYSALQWATSGDGTFDDNSTLNSIYTPGIDDIQNGFVTLDLTAQPLSPCAVVATDMIELTIMHAPVVDAGADQTVCDHAALDAFADHYQSIIWLTNGDGSFSDNSILNPTYTAGAIDLANREVQLHLVAVPPYPCIISYTDMVTIFFDIPEVFTETVSDQVIHSGDTLELVFHITSYSEGSYSWYQNDTLIADVNSPVLIVPKTSVEEAGHYYCIFENECSSVTSQTALITILEPNSHEILLPKGWSGISSHVIPDITEVSVLFDPVIEDLLILYNQDGIFWPEANMNTLINWDSNSGYVIKLEYATTLTFQGVSTYPYAPVTISPGWSLMPVTSPCEVAVAAIFDGNPEIILVKEVSGTGLFWPEMQVNTLEVLVPGRAYQVFNSGENIITVVLPNCED